MATVIDEAAPASAAETRPEATAPSVYLNPPQGQWTIADWVALPDDAPRCELVEGCLELLPVPTNFHHDIQDALIFLLMLHLGPTRASTSGRKIETVSDGGRVVDVMAYKQAPVNDPASQLAATPDLAIEVTSPGKKQRSRDYVEKRSEYARVGIGEYWIVDTDELTVTVLSLDTAEDGYAEVGRFGRGDLIDSPMFPDLKIAVDQVFGGGSRDVAERS